MKHLRIMRYVDEVARTGSIRKAADQLNVTSSAVNRRIMDLEEELGARCSSAGRAACGSPPRARCSSITCASRTATSSA